jgi:hypothetical protein
LKEIAVSKQWIAFALIMILLSVGGWYVVQTFVSSPISATPTPNLEEEQASAAVVAGVEAFFNVDYQKGQDAWLTQFCAVASEGGCQMTKLGAASLWKKYQDAKTVTSAAVTLEQKVKQTVSEQVWRVRIQLSAPLPGSAITVDSVYALAVNTNTGWKFERFLMPEEIQALEQAATQPASGEGSHK